MMSESAEEAGVTIGPPHQSHQAQPQQSYQSQQAQQQGFAVGIRQQHLPEKHPDQQQDNNGQNHRQGVIHISSNSIIQPSKPPITAAMPSAGSGEVVIPEIPYGDVRERPKLRFEVVTARVIETAGKKHVSYTVMVKRAIGPEPHPAVIERRYNDFSYVYECILKNFHPSILGDFMFPKKVLIGNFKAEVITERTEAFHKFLNLISTCDNLLYSDYFYSFLSSEEHNEAVSHIKLSRYEEAVPLLENIFYVREKLLTISNIHVLQCLCELVATLHAVRRLEAAFAFARVAQRSFDLVQGHPDAEGLKISFLKLASQLAEALNQDRKPYDKQLSELRYTKGIKLENAKPLLELIRERYIHRASHTAKLL